MPNQSLDVLMANQVLSHGVEKYSNYYPLIVDVGKLFQSGELLNELVTMFAFKWFQVFTPIATKS